MPITEEEHLHRITAQREYRDTSPVPEDARIALPPPHWIERRPESLYCATCPRCGAEVTSTTQEMQCRCGKDFGVLWPGASAFPGSSTFQLRMYTEYANKGVNGNGVRRQPLKAPFP